MTYRYKRLCDGRLLYFPAGTCHEAIAYIQDSIKDKPIEYAYLLDGDGNLINHAVGDETKVKLWAPSAVRGMDAVYIHNHPDKGFGWDGGFSPGDVYAAITMNVKRMYVVTYKTLYCITRPGSWWNLNAAEVRDFHDNLHKRYCRGPMVFKSYEALCRHNNWALHRTMEETAKKFGFSYVCMDS